MNNKALRIFSCPNIPGALALIISLLVCVSCTPKAVISDLGAQSDSIVKSANDKRQYQRIRLPNNLDVLLISDPETDKAAAALDLYVGSYQNPQKRQGLAHFLEHMLFLGTKQFPKADAYQTFISEHGGRHNASTGLEHTNYFFDINAEYLADALDRFAPFFTDPLFDANYVERERNAVESEYQLKYKNDGRRQWDVLREIANPNHPLSKFNVGSLETLGDNERSNVRAELIDFYNKYYSANLMTLAVLGKESLDQLEKIVRQRFSSIKDKKVSIQPYEASYVDLSALPMQVNIQPLKDTRELGLLFEIPKLNNYWQSKPAQYLASMIGYEGQGSLLQALKAKGWADSLSAGTVLEDRGAGLFSVDIGLTPEGYESRDQILVELFAWIALIKHKGIESWRQKEYAKMSEIAFRYTEKQDPATYATGIARKMHHHKDGDILRASYVTSQFDREIIEAIASRLTPSNMLMFITSSKARVENNSQYYQTPYLSKTLDSEYIDRIKTGISEFKLSLSPSNPFIPEDLVLINTKSYPQPVLYEKKPGLQVWHLQHTDFQTPKAQIIVLLNSKQSQSLNDLSAAKLYAAYISNQLNEELYPALMAGLDYNISASEQGLSIAISGYSDKQEILLHKLIHAVAKPQWDQDRFELIKQQLIRQKNNAKRDYPFRQVLSFFYTVLEGRWSPTDQAQAMENIDMEQLKMFSKDFVSVFNARVLVAGNHDQNSLVSIIKQLEVLNFADTAISTKVAKLGSYDVSREIKVDHNDAVLVEYIQGDNDSIRERATVGLLSQIISAPFYNEMRTQKQLGYVVSAFAMPINRVPGICLIAQSPVASEQVLKNEFSDFNQNFSQQVAAIDAEALDRHKNALLVNIEKTPDNLYELNARHLQSLELGYENFDFRKKLAEAIRAISVSEIKAAYQRLIIDKPRRLWVQTKNRDSLNSVTNNNVPIDQHYVFPY